MKKILIVLAILFTGIINSSELGVNSNRALINAIAKDDINGVQEALANGADINHRDRTYWDTALLWAVHKDNKEIIEILIDSGADLNLKNRDGSSPLMKAAKLGQPEIVKLLLEAGADTTIKNKKGESFLDLIQEAKHFAIKKVYEDYAIEHRIAIAAKLALFLTKDTAGIVAGYCA